jgi:hypothetical protein
VKVDPLTDKFIALAQAGDAGIRVRYRCRASACGWTEWMMGFVDPETWKERRAI